MLDDRIHESLAADISLVLAQSEAREEARRDPQRRLFDSGIRVKAEEMSAIKALGIKRIAICRLGSGDLVMGKHPRYEVWYPLNGACTGCGAGVVRGTDSGPACALCGQPVSGFCLTQGVRDAV